MNSQLDDSNKENLNLKTQITQLTVIVNESKGYQDIIAKLKADMDKLKLQLDQANTVVNNLKIQINNYEIKINECKDNQSQVQKLMDIINNLKIELNNAKDEANTCKAQIAQFNITINQLNTQLSNVDGKYKDQIKALTLELENLRNDNKSLIAFIERLKKQCTDGNNGDNDDVNNLKSINIRLQQEINTCRNVVNQLKLDIQAVFNSNRNGGNRGGLNGSSILIGQSYTGDV